MCFFISQGPKLVPYTSRAAVKHARFRGGPEPSAFWKRMVVGKAQYNDWYQKDAARLDAVANWNRAQLEETKQNIQGKAPHNSTAKDYIPYVEVYAHSALKHSPYSLVDGTCMTESANGVLGTRDATLDNAKADSCWGRFVSTASPQEGSESSEIVRDNSDRVAIQYDNRPVCR
jgi:hypothetical protein